MKKTRVAILFLLLTLFAACLPAAAELPAQITLPCEGEDRVHTFIEYVNFGKKHRGRYQCTHCGYKLIPYSPYEDHSGGTETPTCTTGKTCALCGAKYGILDHAWGEWSSAGNGTHIRNCKNCYKVDTASCTGGTATCTAKAVCEACGGEYGEKDPNNHALVHPDAKAPTCTEPGWDAYDLCVRCGYTTRKELPAQHDFVYHQAKSPTCKEIGFASVACWRCGYFKNLVLPALNHDLKQHAAKAPTCTEKGWDAYETCSRCDYTTYAEQPALNHALVQHDAQAPTCTKPGWDAYKTCSRCDYTTTYQELPALNHDYQAVTVEPTCETDGYTVFTCSRCKDSYTADPTDKLGHQFGAWSPNGTGSQSADCLRQGCAHTGSTDCRKFTFRTAEGETLTFCPVCGQAENAARLEMIEAATAWPLSGSLSAEDVTARTNGEYLSVAFETAGSLTQPTGRVRLALPAGLLEGKTLVRIAPDGTQTEMPFETKRGKIILTLDFVNSELPVMLFRLVPQTAAL